MMHNNFISASLMNPEALFKTMKNNSEFTMRQYITPALYFDPKKEILRRKNADYKNRPWQGKFKPTQKHKPCFMDKHIQPFVPNPSPDRYKTIRNRQGYFQADPEVLKQRRAKSLNALQKLTGSKKKIIVRGTLFDDIEKYEAKYKPPAVGKYDITKDPYPPKFSNRKPKQLPIKFNNLDDVKYISSQIPGPGHHNPHKSVPHLRENKNDLHFYKAKHSEQEAKKTAKLNTTKTSPFLYSPVANNTFDSILKNKKNQRSRWSHGTIDIRSGLRSQYKSPSPADHSEINQWTPNKSISKDSIGKVKLLDRTTRSVKAFSVYH